MRATTMLLLAPMLALANAGLFAQTTSTTSTTTSAPTTTVIGAPSEPVKSTLKPAPGPGDGTRPRQRLVTVFGTEECPKPSSPDEVVVCARLPDSEVYRIPKQLRAANDKRVSPFQANRSLLLGDASGGAGGSIGSCSVIGGGGMIGCTGKDVDAWAQDRASRMGTVEEVPPQ